jgi:hypothetical protein
VNLLDIPYGVRDTILRANPNTLEKEMNHMDERELMVRDSNNHALSWYGWGSPVGLGILVLLLSTSVTLLKIAFR